LTCTPHATDSGSITGANADCYLIDPSTDPTLIGPCYNTITPCRGPINCGGTNYYFNLEILPFWDSGALCWKCDFTFRYYSNSNCATTFLTYFFTEEQSCNSQHDIRGAGTFVDLITYAGYSGNISVSWT
jgi:hypothetical protein